MSTLGFLRSAPGDAQPLLLPAGHVRPALLNPGIVAVRETVDELVGTGDAAGRTDLLIAGRLVAPAQIFPDRTGEQHIFLQDDPDRIPQMSEGIVAHLMAADLQRAFTDIIQTRDQLDQRAPVSYTHLPR